MKRNIASRKPGTDSSGYTLVEILVVLGLAAILMTLGAQAIRHFWFVNSLSGSRDEVTSQLRQLQQKTVSQTHPRVYGARFVPGSSSWALVSYNPDTGACSQDRSLTFRDGVRVDADPSKTTFDVVSPQTSACAANVGPGQYVFFFARGSATGGRVTVTSDQLSRSKVVSVKAITGRVTGSS